MQTKKLYKVILLLLATLALLPAAGCWDAVDINDRGILTALIVDKTDYGYVFYAEEPSIVGGGQGAEKPGKAKPIILKAEGRTLDEAREDLNSMIDQPVFLGAIQSLMMTESMARYDIEEYLNRVRVLNDYRKTVHVIVVDEDPEKLLNITPENTETVGSDIDKTIMGLVNTGKLPHEPLIDVLESLSSPYRHYLLSTISLVNGEVAFTGFSVFSGGMKTGFIPVHESNSIVYMTAADPKFVYVVPYGNTQVTVEVTLTKKKIKPHYEDGKISFDLSLQFKGTFLYPEKNKTVTEMDMEVIRSTLQAILEQEFQEMFVKSQEVYHCDCFKLHESFRISYPEEFKQMDWAGEYQKAKLNLSVNVVLEPSDLVDYNPGGE